MRRRSACARRAPGGCWGSSPRGPAGCGRAGCRHAPRLTGFVALTVLNSTSVEKTWVDERLPATPPVRTLRFSRRAVTSTLTCSVPSRPQWTAALTWLSTAPSPQANTRRGSGPRAAGGRGPRRRRRDRARCRRPACTRRVSAADVSPSAWSCCTDTTPHCRIASSAIAASRVGYLPFAYRKRDRPPLQRSPVM